MGNGPVVVMLHRAIDVWLYNRWTALHNLACVHTALASICGAPVHPRTPGKHKGKTQVEDIPKFLPTVDSLVAMQRT